MQIGKYKLEHTYRKIQVDKIQMGRYKSKKQKSDTYKSESTSRKIQSERYKSEEQSEKYKSVQFTTLQHSYSAPDGGGDIRRIPRIDLPRSVANYNTDIDM